MIRCRMAMVAGFLGCGFLLLTECKGRKQSDAVAPLQAGDDTAQRIAKWAPLLVSEPGTEPDKSRIKSWSFYSIPIPNDGKPHGRSRRWGDADFEVQVKVIECIIADSRKRGWNNDDTAYLLALVRTESGFNPDAAAPESSAAGLSQCIDSTRLICAKRLRILPDTFDIETNLQFLIALTDEAFRFVRRSKVTPGSSDFYADAYRYHHDGPKTRSKKSRVYCGEKVARTQVIPSMEIARTCLSPTVK